MLAWCPLLTLPATRVRCPEDTLQEAGTASGERVTEPPRSFWDNSLLLSPRDKAWCAHRRSTEPEGPCSQGGSCPTHWEKEVLLSFDTSLFGETFAYNRNARLF